MSEHVLNNILITGGAGFIGTNFIRFLLKGEPRVQIVNLDLLTYAGSLENLKELPDAARHSFIHGDICEPALVAEILKKHNIDTIVHFAAESHVDRSIVSPDPFIQTNIVGTFTLLEAARVAWMEDFAGKRFHHVSTDEVFGALGPDDPAFTETTPYGPRSPYSASKAASDHLVRAYFHTYALPVTITNCANNYGPYQFPEKLIPLMIMNATQGAPLPVYGDGRQIRDWLYVEDHCDAIYRVLKQGKSGETYNIGGGNQPYNIDLINELCAILDMLHPASAPHAKLITHVPDRPGHDRRYAMDITKIRTELGWAPRHDIKTGLRAMIAWYLSHPDWIETIQKQKDYMGWLERNYTQRGEK